MIIISHRGNINGADELTENNPENITNCIKRGLDVEIDVWHHDGSFYLGHDKPQYKINSDFLVNKKLWCHAKNIDALYQMNKNSNIHSFWHQQDDFTLTSRNFIWTYPGKPVTSQSIIVTNTPLQSSCYGICTDYPFKFI